MALGIWSLNPANDILNTTKIKDADNKLQATMIDLEAYVASTGAYTTTGISQAITEFLVDNQATFDALQVTWQSQLQSIVDDTVVVEW